MKPKPCYAAYSGFQILVWEQEKYVLNLVIFNGVKITTSVIINHNFPFPIRLWNFPMRLLSAHKVIHKSVYHRAVNKATQTAPQPYVRFLQSWILLALLFTFLFSVSNVVVHWITPYLPQATSNEQSTQLNRTHTHLNTVLMPQYASCIAFTVEFPQNLEQGLPLLQNTPKVQPSAPQMLPLCIIPNKTLTAI